MKDREEGSEGEGWYDENLMRVTQYNYKKHLPQDIKINNFQKDYIILKRGKNIRKKYFSLLR